MCRVETVRLQAIDGARIHARLYTPVASEPADAVVVAHGYLANAGFMENPWAADLTALGLSALFLDRRGHGRREGTWYPPPAVSSPPLSSLYPDIAAAVGYLRDRAANRERRIALLGHSDGGTGAMVVASADWEIVATVSLSASLAPWEYINHVVPRNLLLLYGKEDAFVLAETDAQLVRHATRGYLRGEGTIGRMSDGSARQLARIDGRGHVDLLLSSEARRLALAWLARAFGLEQPIRLAPQRAGWVATGAASLLLLVAFWDGLPPPHRRRERWPLRGAKLAVIALSWSASLFAASRIAPQWTAIPTQEGHIVAGVLLAALFGLGPVALWVWWSVAERPPRVALLAAAARGAAVAVLVLLALEAVLRPIYATPLTGQRGLLFAGFLALAAPAFAATCAAATWVGRGQGLIARAVPVETALAAVTALTAPYWFVRMSMLPVALFALALLFVAAYRAAGRSAVGAGVFGAVIYARLASSVCAFY